jgi:hypothetical protein
LAKHWWERDWASRGIVTANKGAFYWLWIFDWEQNKLMTVLEQLHGW